MKWNDGPIVGKSKLLSWHTGSFTSGNINKLRELCVGTNLFGLNEYWKTVADKIFFVGERRSTPPPLLYVRMKTVK